MADPLVTVVMPIRNEASFITRSLGAVLAQDYPPDKIEVLIADGLSDDGTQDIIRAMPGAERVKIFPNPAKRQAEGLNIIIPMAKGEIIVRVDGHTIIEPNYVQECVNALNTTGASNVGGAMDPIGITLVGKAIAAAGKSSFSVPSAFHVSDQPQLTDTVYLGAWKRTIFDQVGLYNTATTPNEDYELNYRIRQAGGKIYLTPRIKSQYFGRQSFSSLARQYFNYGIGKIQTLRIHPKSLRIRHLVAPAFVAWIVLGVVLSMLHPLVFMLWGFGLLAYGMANLFFSVKVAQKAGLTLLYYLPVVFLTIHLSWGIGFWYGLVRQVISTKQTQELSSRTN